MNGQTYINQMTHTAQAIRQLVLPIGPEQAHWKPNAESWSVLEVVCHLLDEEREDFRPRIDRMLHHPTTDFSPIDPQGWVSTRRYAEQDLANTLAAFLAERESSLSWLGQLTTADWQTNRMAPWGAPLHAGDLLSAWAAHDLLHLRQLCELHYGYLQHTSTPFSPAYAGDW